MTGCLRISKESIFTGVNNFACYSVTSRKFSQYFGFTFTDYDELERKREAEKKDREKERNIQKAVIELKKKYGKNAVLKGMNLQEGAMTIERNGQVGGHKA